MDISSTVSAFETGQSSNKIARFVGPVNDLMQLYCLPIINYAVPKMNALIIFIVNADSPKQQK